MEKQPSEIQEKLAKLSKIYSLLGSDPMKNMDLLVEGACATIAGAASLYNRLDEGSRSLCTWSIFNEPPEYQKKDAPDGHICYEATLRGDGSPVILNDLKGTPYEISDVNVKKYGLRAYIGLPVAHRGARVGSLCVVDTRPRSFETSDVLILSILAKAMEVEEERKHMEEELREKLELLERQREELRQAR
jgi:GAF domain-containing protein